MSVSLILKLTRGLATVLHPVPGIRLPFGLNPYSPQDPIDALTATSSTPAWYRCSKSSPAYEIERPIPKYRPATPISPTCATFPTHVHVLQSMHTARLPNYHQHRSQRTSAQRESLLAGIPLALQAPVFLHQMGPKASGSSWVDLPVMSIYSSRCHSQAGGSEASRYPLSTARWRSASTAQRATARDQNTSMQLMRVPGSDTGHNA